VRAERIGYEKGVAMGRLEQHVQAVNEGARPARLFLVPDGT